MLRSQRLKSSCTVVHNCHGKRNNLAAKEKDSRQKEELHGKNEKTHGKRKNLTTKKKPHGIKKRLTAREKTTRQKEKTDGKRNNLTANEISMSSRHKRERIGAGRFFLLPWHGKNKTYNKTKRTHGKTTAIHGKSQRTHGKTTPIFQGGSEKPRRKWNATADVTWQLLHYRP